MRRIIMARIVRLICAFGALSMSTAVFAAPLNLPKAIPDFSSLTEVTTTYNAGSGAFSVTDGINQYTDNTGSYPASGTFTLNAVIDNTGTLLSGTLTISGFVLFTTPPPVPPAADLLIVDLTDFGFSGAGPSTIFEFTGDTIGGTLAAEFPKGAGVILNPGVTDYAGAFDVDFSGSSGTIDTFYIPDNPIPEPMSLILLLSCIPVIAIRRRR
jgi:hypothetical protein